MTICQTCEHRKTEPNLRGEWCGASETTEAEKENLAESAGSMSAVFPAALQYHECTVVRGSDNKCKYYSRRSS